MLRVGMVAGLCVMSAVTACGGPKTVDLSGTVLDARTSKPIAAATVKAGTTTLSTDAQGHFKFVKVAEKGLTVTASAKYFKAATAPEPVAKPYALTLKLTPNPVPGRVLGNLTGTPLSATITAAGQTIAAPAGTFTAYGVGPGEAVTVAAKGYATARPLISPANQVAVTLLADPLTTARYEATLETSSNWRAVYAFVHPDVRRYLPLATFVSENQKFDNRGVTLISFVVHSAAFVTWHFTGCGANHLHAKTYPHAAAISDTFVYSAPNGGSTTQEGVTHWAQGPGGRWYNFPGISCLTAP